MKPDPIVDEVRRHRRMILDEWNGDFEAMARFAMQRQWSRRRSVVQAPPAKASRRTARRQLDRE